MRNYIRSLLLVGSLLTVPVSIEAQTKSLQIATLGEANSALNAPVTNAVCASGGTKVVFTTTASNVVSGDTNSTYDVFLRDTDTGAISLVSGDPNGNVGDDASGDVLVSSTLSTTPDGRYVTFSSRAGSLLSPPMSSGINHILVHDLQTVSTQLVTRDFSNEPNTTGSSFDPSISEDGTKVAFMSSATNLVNNDTNLIDDIFVRDITKLSTQRASVTSDGQERSFSSLIPRISGDGTLVLFGSFSQLVPDKSSTNFDFFVKNLATGAIERINNTTIGTQPANSAQLAAISRDGRYVAFSSYSNEHVANDSNSVPDVFRLDRQTGVVQMVSTTGSGQLINDAANGLNVVEISPDGRYVLFDSSSSQLIKNLPSNGRISLYLKDTATGGLGLVDVTPSGVTATSPSLKAQICNTSPLKVIFQNEDAQLAPELTLNGANYFLAEVTPPEPPPFEKGTIINAPPQVTVGTTSATLTLASFKGVQVGKKRSSSTQVLPHSEELAKILARAAKPRLNYVVTLTTGKGSRRDVRTKNSTRNTVTFNKLPPGSYSAKYTVQATQNGKVIFKTKASPTATFTIQGR